MARSGVNVDQCTRYAEAAMCGQTDLYAQRIAAISSETQKARVFRHKTAPQVETILVRLSEEIRKSIIGKYCTEEAAKFFDKSAYSWDFAVPRQGFKDYGMRETDPAALDRRVQWIFFKAKNRKVLSRLKKMDFEALSRKNSTIPGFGKADVVAEYERLYPTSATNELIQVELDL